ncbi:MAG: NUDIX hydrolase [Cellvibrionaceae bacterium]
MSFAPHVTVATVIEKDGKFLMVKEQTHNVVHYNQPAGHLEQDESLQTAAARETLEETGWNVELTHYLGVSLYVAPSNGVTYVRHSFSGKPIAHYSGLALDADIIAAEWLSYEEILGMESQLRSPLVKQDIDQYRAGELYPLKIVKGLS